MATYSIKDLEKISGIKAHTLRIWEQRYGLLKPGRTDTNIRMYDDEDLKFILNVSMLNCSGHKISAIAAMSPDQIREQVRSLTDTNLEFSNQVNTLALCMIELDEVRFEKVISVNTLRYGFERTMLNIIYPFFERVGILWQTGSITPAQEHFISNLTRQKLIAAIDGQEVTTQADAPRYLLFLPEGELHELSLLFAHYVLKSRGNRVVYLGQNVPFEDLRLVYDTYKPDYLLTLVTSSTSAGGELTHVAKLGESLPKATILVGGQAVRNLPGTQPSNVRVLGSIEELVSLASEPRKGLN